MSIRILLCAGVLLLLSPCLCIAEVTIVQPPKVTVSGGTLFPLIYTFAGSDVTVQWQGLLGSGSLPVSIVSFDSSLINNLPWTYSPENQQVKSQTSLGSVSGSDTTYKFTVPSSLSPGAYALRLSSKMIAMVIAYQAAYQFTSPPQVDFQQGQVPVPETFYEMRSVGFGGNVSIAVTGSGSPSFYYFQMDNTNTDYNFPLKFMFSGTLPGIARQIELDGGSWKVPDQGDQFPPGYYAILAKSGGPNSNGNWGMTYIAVGKSAPAAPPGGGSDGTGPGTTGPGSVPGTGTGTGIGTGTSTGTGTGTGAGAGAGTDSNTDNAGTGYKGPSGNGINKGSSTPNAGVCANPLFTISLFVTGLAAMFTML